MLHLWLNLLHGRIQQDSSLNPIYSCVQHIAVQVVNIHHCSSQKCTLCRICWINVFLHTFVDGSSKKLYSTSYCGFPRSWEWDGMNLPLLSHLTHSTGSHSLIALKQGHRSVPHVRFTPLFPLSSWVPADILDLSATLDFVHWHPRHFRIQNDIELVAVMEQKQKPVQWAPLRAQGHWVASVQGPVCVHG